MDIILRLAKYVLPSDKKNEYMLLWLADLEYLGTKNSTYIEKYIYKLEMLYFALTLRIRKVTQHILKYLYGVKLKKLATTKTSNFVLMTLITVLVITAIFGPVGMITRTANNKNKIYQQNKQETVVSRKDKNEGFPKITKDNLVYLSLSFDKPTLLQSQRASQVEVTLSFATKDSFKSTPFYSIYLSETSSPTSKFSYLTNLIKVTNLTDLDLTKVANLTNLTGFDLTDNSESSKQLLAYKGNIYPQLQGGLQTIDFPTETTIFRPIEFLKKSIYNSWQILSEYANRNTRSLIAVPITYTIFNTSTLLKK